MSEASTKSLIINAGWHFGDSNEKSAGSPSQTADQGEVIAVDLLRKIGIVSGMSLLDTAQLAAIYDLAGPDLVEMLEDMAVRSRELLGQLEVAVAGGDLAAGAEIAHQLKGAAASMGLAVFHEGSGRVEDALRAGNSPENEELQGLGEILEESVKAVRGYLAG